MITTMNRGPPDMEAAMKSNTTTILVAVGALLVGIVDTAGRAFLPTLLNAFLPLSVASNLGPALAAIAIYVLMAAVLFFKPSGLFPARG